MKNEGHGKTAVPLWHLFLSRLLRAKRLNKLRHCHNLWLGKVKNEKILVAGYENVYVLQYVCVKHDSKHYISPELEDGSPLLYIGALLLRF